MNNEILIKEIYETSQCGKLIFFIGSGVSSISGYPSWKELIIKMTKDLSYQLKEDKAGEVILSTDEYLKIPQMYFDKFSERKYLSKIKRQFSKKCNTNIIHDKIMELNPNHIITTNYDYLIEKAITKYGKNYSVINSDMKVSKVESNHYLMKVHGDFDHKQFVLKENDYIEYSDNYKLIDNVMKTLMSTNVVVFIGYSLNDYNIKIIINWIKKVQGSSFINPIFIYASKENLTDYEIKYYEAKGLRIIDANRTGKDEFEDKYFSILNKAILYPILSKKNNKNFQLDILFEKIKYAFQLNYLCINHFKSVFDNDYEVDEFGWIHKSRKEAVYIETFFENKDYYMSKRKKEFNAIVEFFAKYDIIGMYDKKNHIKQFRDFRIKDEFFESYYCEIEEYVKDIYKSIEENYKKAQYLIILGEFEASYNLYLKLIDETRAKNDWLYYFLCQINRHYVYRIVKRIKNPGFELTIKLNYGDIECVSKEFTEKIKNEMGNFDIRSLFEMLPYKYRKHFSFIKSLSSNDFFYRFNDELLTLKTKIEQNKANNSFYLNTPDFDKVIINLYDNLNFIYKNHISVDRFSELKSYVRNSIIAYIDGIFGEKEKISHPIFGNMNKREFILDYYDFIIITKNFDNKSIEYLANKYDFRELKYNQEDEIKKYIKRVFDYYLETFDTSITPNRFVLYTSIKEEISNILYLAPYFFTETDNINYIVEFMLMHLNDRELSGREKYNIISRVIKKANIETIKIIEKHILSNFKLIERNKDISEHNAYGLFTGEFGVLINEIDKSYISDLISDYCLSLGEMSNYQKRQFLKLTLIINEKAVNHWRKLIKIDNVKILLEMYNLSLIDDTDIKKYKAIIKEYLDEQIERNRQSEGKIVYSAGPGFELQRIGLLIEAGFLGNKSQYFKYADLDDEYKFIVSFENFNRLKFEFVWFLKYPKWAIEIILSNEERKKFILGKIEEEFSAIENKKLRNLLFNIYKFEQQNKT